MALNCGPLSAGDQRNWLAYRFAIGDLSAPASASALVSGDSCLVARPEALPAGPAPRPAARRSFRAENRRAAGGGRRPTRVIKGRERDGRGRGRPSRFSPYPAPGVKLELLRSVLRRRLLASEALWPPAFQLNQLRPLD